MTPQILHDFWFEPNHEKLWFRSTPQFDRQIRERFEALWQSARAGQLGSWEQTAEGALALVILLDQMPLNMYRGQAESFASEAQSMEVARRAVARHFDRSLSDKGNVSTSA